MVLLYLDDLLVWILQNVTTGYAIRNFKLSQCMFSYGNKLHRRQDKFRIYDWTIFYELLTTCEVKNDSTRSPNGKVYTKRTDNNGPRSRDIKEKAKLFV